MALQQYSDKELRVFLCVIFPYTIIINFMALGECVYSSTSLFLSYAGLTMIYFFAGYFVFGVTGGFIQRRLPSSQDLFKRIGLMLPVFYIMNIFLILGFYAYYENLITLPCQPVRDNFLWVLGFGCFASTVITFINEGAVNWSRWKKAVTETEQLKNAYQKSRLYGLKGQINPHFLFNCFNSLSSLISENEEQAEHFLNEMTKVHRYMLRTDDEQLVLLEQEVKFARSYLHLIAVRFGSAVQFDIDVPENIMNRFLPPLSLQVILENIIYTNAASKSEPLQLRITGKMNKLVIQHSIQTKIIIDEGTLLEGLDNLITKYRLMGAEEVEVIETDTIRTITLPLFTQTFSVL
ncbi:MAG: histidine kinase [Chitinophagaceae bacterium]|nr:histidine kinase [Chitinophagaceae bacterium]MCW5927806.1 histidine kinase [Chitinophagaceae bacterium]